MPPPRAALRLAGQVAIAVGILFPPALIAVTVVRYGVNIPYWDQWELVDLLGKLHAGGLAFSDLWAQHNEHRIVFPRLVMLGLAATSRWDVRYEAYGNLVAAALTLFLLWKLLALTTRRIDPALSRWLAFPASLFTFSLAQWENWTWGWQIQVFMSVLGGVAAVWGLARLPGSWRGLAVAFGAAVFAVFSFAIGLVLLAIVPFGVLLGGRARRGPLLLASVALGALVVGLYYAGYNRPQLHPWLPYVMAHPAEYLAYVLAYLGAPVGGWAIEAAETAGLLGLVLLGGSAGWLWWHARAARGVITPWLLLAAYAGASAAGTGLARAGFGTDQALSGRYTTVSALFWNSLFVIVGVAGACAFRRGGPYGPRRLPAVAVAAALTTLVAAGYATTAARGYSDLRARRAGLLSAEECLLYYEGAADSCLRRLYPVPAAVRERARVLEALGLSVFAPGQRPVPLSSYVVHAPPAGLEAGTIDLVRGDGGDAGPISRGGRVHVAGWARDPNRGLPARAVLVTVDGEVMGAARVRGQRPDVARFFDRPEMGPSGWRYGFAAFRLSPGRHLVEAYAVLRDGKGVVRLPGARSVVVTE